MLRARWIVPIFFISGHCYSQLSPGDYTRTVAEVVARDGVKLHTVLFCPKSHDEKWPILFSRTPYGVDQATLKDGYIADLVKEGYVFAFQDIRGHYGSGGKFVMMRPWRDKKDPKAIDEATDAYDSIDWMIHHVEGNNGRVGMYGISYDGWTALSAAVDPHPALKAASPQASPLDMFINDDFHRNGAFRLSYGFEYAYAMETSKEWNDYPFHARDTYEWYLNLGPLSNVNAKYFHGRVPTWTSFTQHPLHDKYSMDQSVAPLLTSPKLPILNVAGWWDQEDPWGPVESYRLLKRNDPNGWNGLCIGPWNHGGWAGNGASLLNLKFGTDTGTDFKRNVQAPFFAFWLKDKGSRPSLVTTFQTGENAWRKYSSWPPPQARSAKIYLGANGSLGFNKPMGASGIDSYLSDPAHPIPYRTLPIEATYSPGSRWYTWQVEDQRFVDHRPDVASWKSGVLSKDVTISGPVWADLFAATTGTDADWVVKLIDVYPDEVPGDAKMGGYELPIAADVLRGRFRKSLEQPEPIKPNTPLEYHYRIGEADHVFKKGHRIMVQIQSSWFPVIDRNPQKYVPNIFEAKASDFQKATQSVFHSAKFPTAVEVFVQ